MEACGPGPIISHGTFRKAVSTLVMQIGRGLTQGVKSSSQLWESCGKDGGWDLFQEISKYRDHKEAIATDLSCVSGA